MIWSIINLLHLHTTRLCQRSRVITNACMVHTYCTAQHVLIHLYKKINVHWRLCCGIALCTNLHIQYCEAYISFRPIERFRYLLGIFLLFLSSMSGQSVLDRMNAARHTITGSDLAKSVFKATTEEILGPKKKHLDCKYLFMMSKWELSRRSNPANYRLPIIC